MPAVSEVMVRTYEGKNQMDAARMYAEDAPNLAAEGWTPVTQDWVADEWSTAAIALAAVLVLVGIGIILLAVMAFIKPMRDLMVTYDRADAAAR
jgi:CHASE3 domain sensor protein